MSLSSVKGLSGRAGRARTAGKSPMMRHTFALLVLMVAATAVAQEDVPVDNLAGTYADHQGETDAGHDIRRVFWTGADAAVTVDLHGGLPDGSALTAILYVGTEGNVEPDQAYILHHGPGGDRVLLASNGTAPGLTVEANNDSVAFRLDTELEGPCVFAVARTVSYHAGGQTVEDVVGWSGTDIENAWNNGVACSQGQPVDAPANIGDTDVGVPSVSLAWLAAGLVAVAMMLRRTQRS